MEISLRAEEVLKTVSSADSRAARVIAHDVHESFMNLRLLVRKYAENIEVVDPQLRNNPELVEALEDFEKSWEKGKEYLVDREKFGFLLRFSGILERTGERLEGFKEQVEC